VEKFYTQYFSEVPPNDTRYFPGIAEKTAKVFQARLTVKVARFNVLMCTIKVSVITGEFCIGKNLKELFDGTDSVLNSLTSFRKNFLQIL
jgi:hypothetical protein